MRVSTRLFECHRTEKRIVDDHQGLRLLGVRPNRDTHISDRPGKLETSCYPHAVEDFDPVDCRADCKNQLSADFVALRSLLDSRTIVLIVARIASRCFKWTHQLPGIRNSPKVPQASKWSFCERRAGPAVCAISNHFATSKSAALARPSSHKSKSLTTHKDNLRSTFEVACVSESMFSATADLCQRNTAYQAILFG